MTKILKRYLFVCAEKFWLTLYYEYIGFNHLRDNTKQSLSWTCLLSFNKHYWTVDSSWNWKYKE